MSIPTISFSNNRNEISTVLDCTVNFQVNENFVEFEARATKSGEPYGRGIGNLIMQMKIQSPNYYPANTNYTFVVNSSNLTSGDGTYRISMYAKNVGGTWSDAVAFEWDGDNNNGWDRGTWV